MKSLNLTTVKRIGLFLLAATIFTTSINAANSQTGGKQIGKNSKMNLVQGIKSSNYGVKRDCIYFSALYDIKEAVDVLQDELNVEKDPRTRVLISLALYRLAESSSVDQIYGSALTDWNKRVQIMSDEIVNFYKTQKDAVASFNGD